MVVVAGWLLLLLLLLVVIVTVTDAVACLLLMTAVAVAVAIDAIACLLLMAAAVDYYDCFCRSTLLLLLNTLLQVCITGCHHCCCPLLLRTGCYYCL